MGSKKDNLNKKTIPLGFKLIFIFDIIIFLIPLYYKFVKPQFTPYLLNIFSTPLIEGVIAVLFLLAGIILLTGRESGKIFQVILIALFLPVQGITLLFIGGATGFKAVSSSGEAYAIFSIIYIIVSIGIVLYLFINKKAKGFFK